MRIVLAILICIILTAGPSSAAEKLRVGVDVPYPPFAFYDQAGELAGFDVEIARALCRSIERECDLIILAFDQVIPAILAGSIDFAVVGMSPTPQRLALVDLTDRYFRSHSIFIEKPDTVSGTTPEELRGLRIGVQSATIQEAFLRSEYPDSIIVPRIEYGELFRLLGTGDVDLVLTDGLPGYAYLGSEVGRNFETVGEPVSSAELSSDSCVTVSKVLPELRDKLNTAIQAIRRSGEYGRINRRYFEYTIY